MQTERRSERGKEKRKKNALTSFTTPPQLLITNITYCTLILPYASLGTIITWYIAYIVHNLPATYTYSIFCNLPITQNRIYKCWCPCAGGYSSTITFRPHLRSRRAYPFKLHPYIQFRTRAARLPYTSLPLTSLPLKWLLFFRTSVTNGWVRDEDATNNKTRCRQQPSSKSSKKVSAEEAVVSKS
ncbi:hypothetical protein F4805DRAFT_429422 [Annulohypoxylon moriforme]|nr:hypothetical protein F4805DRAFT_429422 [Annulohypoxylon moriforme]